MPPTLTISVRLGSRSYPIWIGNGILPSCLTAIPSLKKGISFFLVADSRLKSIARQIQSKLAAAYESRVALYFLRGGERTKEISNLIKLYSSATRAAMDRQSVVIALGGGVIGDLTGYFAATYLRGIRLVQIPSTLVAQVDSALGGKTGINLPGGKNLVGAFHQPILVVADISLLKTLPEREFRAGLAEVIKYGVISDPVLFERLEKQMDRILKRDFREFSWIVQRCCAIKAKVVSRDEKETAGLRAILNFGHTIGHGIEAAAHYTMLHGEAIALGMIAATVLSEKMAGLSGAEADRIRSLIERAGLPVKCEMRPFDRLRTGNAKCGIQIQRIMAAIRLDKKAVRGETRMVLAKRIGLVKTGIPVSESEIQKALLKLKD